MEQSKIIDTTETYQLVAAWERRWNLGGCGPGRGPVDVFGKGLSAALRSSTTRILPGASWVSSARIVPRIVAFWSSSDIVC